MNQAWGRGACVAVLVMLACGGSAHAGRPLTTDDAGVLEAHSCEWETYAARLRDKGNADARTTGWQSQLGCGLGHGTQASLGYGGAHTASDDAETVGLAAKFELLAGNGARPALTATLGVNALRVVGSAFLLKDDSAALVLTQGFAPGWTAHANLGVTHDHSAHKTSSLWNLALERALTERFDLAGEVYGDDRGSLWLAGGLRWTPRPAFSLNASIGQNHGVRLVSVGGKISF